MISYTVVRWPFFAFQLNADCIQNSWCHTTVARWPAQCFWARRRSLIHRSSHPPPVSCPVHRRLIARWWWGCCLVGSYLNLPIGIWNYDYFVSLVFQKHWQLLEHIYFLLYYNWCNKHVVKLIFQFSKESERLVVIRSVWKNKLRSHNRVQLQWLCIGCKITVSGECDELLL